MRVSQAVQHCQLLGSVGFRRKVRRRTGRAALSMASHPRLHCWCPRSNLQPSLSCNRCLKKSWLIFPAIDSMSSRFSDFSQVKTAVAQSTDSSSTRSTPMSDDTIIGINPVSAVNHQSIDCRCTNLTEQGCHECVNRSFNAVVLGLSREQVYQIQSRNCRCRFVLLLVAIHDVIRCCIRTL